jgi:DNA polymerase-1
MFFDNKDLVSRKHARIRQAPDYIDTGWIPPTEFPNLKGNISMLSFDTETKETDFDKGPGWARSQGHIVGVSVAARDSVGNEGAWYFPLRHEIEPQFNMNTQNVFGWLTHVLDSPSVPKVGANLTYDIGWLAEEQVTVTGELHDVQFAEALLDSEAKVALEVLGRKYVKRGKESSAMYEWQAQAYPNTPETKRRGDIYRTPAKLVGPYALDDAILPLHIFDKQQPLLRAENLEYVYRLECDLIPLMIKMRQEGVTIDRSRAKDMLEKLQAETTQMFQQIKNDYDFALESSDSGQVAKLLAKAKIETPTTEAGNPSIQKEWLASLTHPLGKLINDIREHEKICGTFLQAYILDKSIDIYGSNNLAKLHPQFHQLKGDENGTVVGRFSSSSPNLQNIPSRTKLGKAVRTCFVPDAGHSHWQKNDYSQIHYRILAHNAVGPGADELRLRYIENPKTDYHTDVYMKVAPLMGWSTTDKEVIKDKRRPIKNVNFGLLYGQGKDALSYKSGLTGYQADEFFEAYHKGAPYVKPTMELIAKEVQKLGYVETLLGRRIRFPLWEPNKKDWDNPEFPLHFDAAIRKWGSAIKRAYDYRGVNYKFQGSEPDIMKKGLRDCWQSGVFDVTGVPRLTVHDEIDFSVRDQSPTTREAFDFIRATMQNSIQLRVPVYVDESTGPTWGEAD